MKKSFLVYRVCTFMLCLVLMLVIFPISVFAAKDMFTTYQIDDVTITGIDTPTAGKTFDFTAEEASQKYNIIKVAWREQNGSNYITSTSSTASAGKNYTVYVVLEVATANHYFNTDSSRRPAVSSVTVNGNTASASNTQDYSLFSIDASKYEHDTTYQKYLVVMYTFPTVEAAPIESVEFDIPALVPGERVPSTWQASGIGIDAINGNNEEVTLYYTFPKIAEHKHSPLKVDEVNATCKEAGKKAYYFCPECGKNFEDAKCTKEIADINSWGKIEKLEHTGGKATCENRAICKNCGEYYGELAEHSFGSAWDYKDASGHAHKCKVCGINDTIISHSGGTAKCGGLAKCAECKAEYGEVMQHQWSETPNYTDKNGHAHKCTICGEHDTVVKHTPGAEATETSAQLCTVCGYMIKPKLSHEHSLAKMDEVDATCTTSGKKAYYYCKSCNAIFSDSKGNNEIVDDSEIIIEATGHKESKWKSDEDTHWKECTVKGCGEIVVGKEAHDFNKSGKCTVCSYRQESGDDSEQVSDTDDKSDTTPDGEKVDDVAPASDNTAMWIAVIACGIVALACIIVVAVVLTKKNKKN